MIIILSLFMARPLLPPLLVSVVALLGFAGQPARAAKPVVVAVDGTLCDLTRTMAADQASVVCLIPPGGDPHGYRLKPSDRQAISQAALVLHVGFGLTPAVSKLRSPGTIVAVGEVALPNYKGSDPHVWHDPANSAAMVRVIRQSMSFVLPSSERALLDARAVPAAAVFNALQSWGAKQIASIPASQRVFVTDHKTYSHLEKRFGIKEISMLDSHTTGGVLRPSSLRKISDVIKQSGAKVIFTPSFPPSKTLRRISKSTGLPIASNPLYGEGVAAGQSSISTATSNICTIVNAQGGACDREGAQQLDARWSQIR